MFAQHREPNGAMWPYVGLLGLLFVLSVTAPRAWRPRQHPTASVAVRLPRHDLAAAKSTATVAYRRPAKEAIVQRLESQGPQPIASTAMATVVPTCIQFDEVLADFEWDQFSPICPAEAPADEPEVLELALAMTPDTSASAPELIVPPSIEAFTPIEDALDAVFDPTALIQRLDALACECECSEWALRASKAVRRFASNAATDWASAAAALDALRNALRDGETLAETTARADLATSIRRANDALRRRLGIWEAASAPFRAAPRGEGSFGGDAADIGLALIDVEALVAARSDTEAWREYLLLDQLRGMNEARASVADDARRQLAAAILDRLAAPQLSVDDRRAIADVRVQRLATALQGWTGLDATHRGTLQGVEAFELELLPSDAQRLAALAHRSEFSPHAHERQLAAWLEQRYRNANVRVEFAADFVSRLLPEPPPRDADVRETILGVPNRGRSRTTARLHLRTSPERGRLGLVFLAAGNVDSWTTAESGPARLFNEGQARFEARRRLRFDRSGVHAEPVLVSVESETQLRRVQTDFDGLPFLGRLVQTAVRSRFDEKRSAAKREAEEKIKRRVSDQLMRETETALAATNVEWREKVVTPLDRLGLAPRVIEAESNEVHAVLRLRLAGDGQLGSHTPRPRLPAGTQFGLQIHQSAFNNVLEGMDLNGREFTLPELAKWLATKLNRDDALPNRSLREDVSLRFADENAVYARLADGGVELNLALAELATPHRTWRDFQVRIAYRPAADQLSARLEQDGVIELRGESVSGAQVALRGIFSGVFPAERPWLMIPPHVANLARLQDLAVTHLVIDDGWLSLGITPAPTVAKQKAAAQR